MKYYDPSDVTMDESPGGGWVHADDADDLESQVKGLEADLMVADERIFELEREIRDLLA